MVFYNKCSLNKIKKIKNALLTMNKPKNSDKIETDKFKNSNTELKDSACIINWLEKK